MESEAVISAQLLQLLSEVTVAGHTPRNNLHGTYKERHKCIKVWHLMFCNNIRMSYCVQPRILLPGCDNHTCNLARCR